MRVCNLTHTAGRWMTALGMAVLLYLVAPQAPLTAQTAPVVTVKVVQGGESTAMAADLRKVVVSQTVNPPDPFPGYMGALGWGGITYTKRGTFIIAFNAGYWHVSAPTPLVMSDSARKFMELQGMPKNVIAPTGGRIMFVRSEDGGKTWSKPKTLADTHLDDRGADLLTLLDGTVLCTWFTSAGGDRVDPRKIPKSDWTHALIARSIDDGRTWSAPQQMLTDNTPNFPYGKGGGDGPAVLMKDGSLLFTVYTSPEFRGKEVAGVLKSTDRGRTWKLVGTVRDPRFALAEAHTVELPDGRLVMIARDYGETTWSSDGGKTWTPLVNFGFMMSEPKLYVLPDGTLLCLFGDINNFYGKDDLTGQPFMATFSTDGGKTWIAPTSNRGFMVDRHSYGYKGAVVLPDGSVMITYQGNNDMHLHDPQLGILTIRLRVRADHSGIDLLPPVIEKTMARE